MELQMINLLTAPPLVLGAINQEMESMRPRFPANNHQPYNPMVLP
jgi:hypothetical protein